MFQKIPKLTQAEVIILKAQGRELITELEKLLDEVSRVTSSPIVRTALPL